MEHIQIKLIYPSPTGRVAKEVKNANADWPAGGRLAAGCPSTHALSARDPITSKSIFAQLVIIVRNVFDSSLFGYQAGSNANQM